MTRRSIKKQYPSIALALQCVPSSQRVDQEALSINSTVFLLPSRHRSRLRYTSTDDAGVHGIIEHYPSVGTGPATVHHRSTQCIHQQTGPRHVLSPCHWDPSGGHYLSTRAQDVSAGRTFSSARCRHPSRRPQASLINQRNPLSPGHNPSKGDYSSTLSQPPDTIRRFFSPILKRPLLIKRDSRLARSRDSCAPSP
ncbi:hypothetical protein CPC08DRAFT_711765 [Agrocybe pediades]|nr:hypothetical protein CPC08DRAFT_711765 [Agrocybe pediades]